MRVYISFETTTRNKAAHAVSRVESALSELGISSTSSSVVDEPLGGEEELGPIQPIPGQENLPL